MPLDFPEDALETLALEMDQTARDWAGDGTKRARLDVADKWRRKAGLVRQAIDAYRALANKPAISRRERFARLVEQTADKMDHKARAAGDR